MGNYLNANGMGPKGKADFLVKNCNAVLLNGEPSGPVESEAQVLVCVMENAMFDAALIVNSEREFRAATYAADLRPKKWLLLSKADARKMADRPEGV